MNTKELEWLGLKKKTWEINLIVKKCDLNKLYKR